MRKRRGGGVPRWSRSFNLSCPSGRSERWRGGGFFDRKLQSLILIKNIKGRPQSLSVWSAHNPPDIRILQRHSEPRSERRRGAPAAPRLGDFKVRKVNGKFVLSSPHLCSCLLPHWWWWGEGNWEEKSGSCGSRTAAKRALKAASLPVTDGF